MGKRWERESYRQAQSAPQWKPKKAEVEVPTSFPVEFLSCEGDVVVDGKYYTYTLYRELNEMVTTTTSVTRHDDKVKLGAGSAEHKRVVTAIREALKGTI